MTISNSLKFTGAVVASSTTGTLYTVPAARFAKVNFAAGGPAQPQVPTFQGSLVAGFVPPLLGQLLVNISNPSNALKLAFSTVWGNPSGPYQVFIQGLNTADLITPNSRPNGFLVTANFTLGRTNQDIINIINTYLTVNYGAAAGALTFTNPTDGTTLFTSGDPRFFGAITLNNIPAVEVNANPASFVDLSPLVDLAHIPDGKATSFVMSAGQTLQVTNVNVTDSTSYDLAVVEFSN